MKILNFEIFSKIFSQINYIKIVNNTSLSLKKSTVLLLKLFKYFSKIYEILGKFQEQVNKNKVNSSNIHKYLNHDKLLRKTKFKIF